MFAKSVLLAVLGASIYTTDAFAPAGSVVSCCRNCTVNERQRKLSHSKVSSSSATFHVLPSWNKYRMWWFTTTKVSSNTHTDRKIIMVETAAWTVAKSGWVRSFGRTFTFLPMKLHKFRNTLNLSYPQSVR